MWHLFFGTMLSGPSYFRKLIGIPQYLLFTRLDIAYAVNKLSQSMHKPIDDHWQVAKRILRYLAGMPTLGIFFFATNKLVLHWYSNVDGAGDSYDFVSTNSYIIYLGHHLISWASKEQNGVARSFIEATFIEAKAELLLMLPWKLHGSALSLENLELDCLYILYYPVIMLVPLSYAQIMFFTRGWRTLLLTITSYVDKSKKVL